MKYIYFINKTNLYSQFLQKYKSYLYINKIIYTIFIYLFCNFIVSLIYWPFATGLTVTIYIAMQLQHDFSHAWKDSSYYKKG